MNVAVDLEALPRPPAAHHFHSGHRIVAYLLGDVWSGIVHAPDGAIVGTVEGASAQEVMVRGVGLVNKLLAAKTPTA